MRPVPAAVVFAALSAFPACGAVTFRPETALRSQGTAATATIDSLRVNADGRLVVTTRWTVPEGGFAVGDARVVPLRQRACADGAVLGHASRLRVAGGPVRWDRPVAVDDGGTLEIEIPDVERALAADAAIDVDVVSQGALACVRLPLVEGHTGWKRETAGAIGLGVVLDRTARIALLRPGIWTGSYRHGLELGVGDSGGNYLLRSGTVVVLGGMSERIWALPIGFYGASLTLGYQARMLVEDPGASGPRLVHGPRVVVRPATFLAVHPARLPLGAGLGYFSFMEFSGALWLSGDGGARGFTIGVGFTWDRPIAWRSPPSRARA